MGSLKLPRGREFESVPQRHCPSHRAELIIWKVSTLLRESWGTKLFEGFQLIKTSGKNRLTATKCYFDCLAVLLSSSELNVLFLTRYADRSAEQNFIIQARSYVQL
jgi:hypothetical protein